MNLWKTGGEGRNRTITTLGQISFSSFCGVFNLSPELSTGLVHPRLWQKAWQLVLPDWTSPPMAISSGQKNAPQRFAKPRWGLRVNGVSPFNPDRSNVVPLDQAHFVALPFALVSLVNCLGSYGQPPNVATQSDHIDQREVLHRVMRRISKGRKQPLSD